MRNNSFQFHHQIEFSCLLNNSLRFMMSNLTEMSFYFLNIQLAVTLHHLFQCFILEADVNWLFIFSVLKHFYVHVVETGII